MLNEVSVPFDTVINLNYAYNTVYSINLDRGSYLFEVWGSSGGDTLGGSGLSIQASGGLGGYSRGVLNLEESLVFYAYIGGSGSSHTTDNPTISYGGFNGGGDSVERDSYGGGAGGGGSTDICTIKSEFSLLNGHLIRSQESYQSRIIVAGGGGGSFGIKYNYSSYYRVTSNGGHGGGFESVGSGYNQSYGCTSFLFCDSLNQGDTSSSSYNYVTGSNQLSTGVVGCFSGTNSQNEGAQPGFFGYGGKSIKSGINSGGGGGGGWFGGYSGTSGHSSRGTGGAGGSGYFHNGTSSFSSLGASYILRDSILIDGNSHMPTTLDSHSSELGHHGHGFARITLLTNFGGRISTCRAQIVLWNIFILLISLSLSV